MKLIASACAIKESTRRNRRYTSGVFFLEIEKKKKKKRETVSRATATWRRPPRCLFFSLSTFLCRPRSPSSNDGVTRDPTNKAPFPPIENISGSDESERTVELKFTEEKACPPSSPSLSPFSPLVALFFTNHLPPPSSPLFFLLTRPRPSSTGGSGSPAVPPGSPRRKKEARPTRRERRRRRRAAAPPSSSRPKKVPSA